MSIIMVGMDAIRPSHGGDTPSELSRLILVSAGSANGLHISLADMAMGGFNVPGE